MNNKKLYECAICFEEYDKGYMEDKDICCFCHLNPNIYGKNKLHPIKQTPISFCTCGKPYNSFCRMEEFFDIQYPKRAKHVHKKIV